MVKNDKKLVVRNLPSPYLFSQPVIASGSHTPGVTAIDFGLPPGTALRYEQPAEALRPFFSTYAVLDSESLDPSRAPEWQLPGWAQIWIVLTDKPIGVRIGNRHYQRLGSAILYGVTSRAMPTTSDGGVTIAIDISPVGWTRLFGPAAEALRDRITPLDQVLSPELVSELIAVLHASDRSLQVKDVLDSLWLRHLPAPNRDEEVVGQVASLLNDTRVTNLSEAAAAAGIGPRTLRRLSKRCFGFPPKLLLIRTRFLRSLIPMLLDESDAPVLAEPYHDLSHLNRDARRFLGMTARRFAALPNPYLRAALRARRLVTGAATPALDP